MTGFLARRLALAVPTLFGVCLVVFVTAQLVPGDPAASLLGPMASPETRRQLEERLGLDQPLPLQFVSWLSSVVQGDLGTSIQQQLPVRSLVWEAFGNTLLLAGAGGIVAVGAGVAIGTVTALYRRRPAGRLGSAASILAMSAPQYSVALLLVAVFSVGLGVLPAGGMTTIGGGGPVDLLRHIVLPALAVAAIPAGITARLFQTVLTDVMNSDFVDGMRGRGLPEPTVVRHAVYAALPSLLTIAGLQLAYLIGGVVFVETIFSWPGIGGILYQAIAARDLPVIQGGVLFVAFAFVLINIVVDGAHAAIDPRVRR